MSVNFLRVIAKNQKSHEIQKSFNCLVGLNEKQIYLFCNCYLFHEVMGSQNLKVTGAKI